MPANPLSRNDRKSNQAGALNQSFPEAVNKWQNCFAIDAMAGFRGRPCHGSVTRAKRSHTGTSSSVATEVGIADTTKRTLLAGPLVCRYCGIVVTRGGPGVELNLEYDHVVAVRVGGSGRPANIVLSCRRCNRRKQGLQAILLPVFLNALNAEADRDVLSIYAIRRLTA